MANRGLSRTLLSVVLNAISWIPNLVLHRPQGSAAESVTGDPAEHLVGPAADLTAPPGARCARCGGELAGRPVRRAADGFVHGSCPAIPG